MWKEPAASPQNGAYQESPQCTLEANLEFSLLTSQVSRTIVFTAVRAEPEWRIGCGRIPSKNIEIDFLPQQETRLIVQMSESSATPSDRRQAPRTKLAEIAYLGMGPENGGVVLDVSDGGLSFHAVATVEPAQTVRFLLSLRGHSRIEGAGEVVWTNQTRTVCGLKFTSLSSGAREYLNDWTNQSRMPAAARKENVAPTPQPVSALSAASRSEALPVFAIPPAAEPALSIPETSKLWQQPVFFWTLFGVLAATLVVSAFLYGVHVGRSEVSSAAQSVPNTTSQIGPPALPLTPVPASSAATDDHSSASDMPAVPTGATSSPKPALVNTSKAEDISGNTEQRPGAEGNSAATAEQRAELQLEAGKSELAAAQAYLSGAKGNRDSSKAARLLWAAVANGNSTAEALLADLYLRGDGVAKSCEQGRILLKAASKSGNADAEEKLKELNANGCQ